MMQGRDWTFFLLTLRFFSYNPNESMRRDVDKLNLHFWVILPLVLGLATIRTSHKQSI